MISFYSVDHQTASLQEREQLFDRFSGSDRGPSVFLQTCNRMELYYGDGDVPHDVARHLFRVTCGLESAIIGERAVQGQVKDAYLRARISQKLPAGMHKLFECALEVGKRVRNETQVSRGAVSHGLAAIELIEEEGINLKDSRITIIGVNKLTADILKFLQNKGARLVFLGNRSKDKAHRLADPFGISVFGLDERKAFLASTDILISATSARHLIVRRDDISVSHPLTAIDLAFPRDIDPSVASMPNVRLFNLDDVERRVQKNISVRRDEVSKAEAIIEDEIAVLDDIMERRRRYATA